MRRRYALEGLGCMANGRTLLLAGPGRITALPPPPPEQAAAGRLIDDLIAEAADDTELFGACLMLAAARSWTPTPREASRPASCESAPTPRSCSPTRCSSSSPTSSRSRHPRPITSGSCQPTRCCWTRSPQRSCRPPRLAWSSRPNFVLRRHDDRCVVVEIEKPHDPLITSKFDLSALFTHAVGQVLDFQQWIADNAAYAQKSFPGIASPAGLVVMGPVRACPSEPAPS